MQKDLKNFKTKMAKKKGFRFKPVNKDEIEKISANGGISKNTEN